jgi:TetR/AcrR family transcriptional regulator, cholesterol catabolism regulator
VQWAVRKGSRQMAARDAPNVVRRSQGRRTQEAIYDAAIRSFAAKGYAGTSLRSLAAEVGIEVGSLYRHFTSKEELLYNIIRKASDDFYARLTEAVARADDRPIARLRAVTEETARYHAVHRAQSFVGSSEVRELAPLHFKHVIKQRNMVEALYKSLVEECVGVGYYPKGTNVSITSNFVISVATSVAVWFDPSGPLTPERVARMAADFAVPEEPAQAERLGAVSSK